MSPLLEVQGLSKFFGGLRATDNLGFAMEEGRILGVIGPNGAGKTTVINLVSGVYLPDRGQIRFAGRDITRLPGHVRARLGLVRTFQAATNYRESTVWENAVRGAFVHLYPGLWHTVFHTRRARALQRDVEGHVEKLLSWLNMAHLAHVEAAGLPYGYQKTLGLVIALAARPRLVMLDEPAAGLSLEETKHVRDVIRRVSQSGVTVLVVDHNMRFISDLCHHLVVLHHGAELAQGAPEGVIRHPAVIEAYLGKGYASADAV